MAINKEDGNRNYLFMGLKTAWSQSAADVLINEGLTLFS